MIWHVNSNTIKKNFMNRATVFYHFFEYGDLALVGKDSWYCQESIGIVLLLWNVLYVCFQFWNFWEKSAKCSWGFSAACLSFWLGLCLYMYEEWFRLTKQVQNPCFNAFQICDFPWSFSIFFPSKHCQSWEILSLLDVHEILSE